MAFSETESEKPQQESASTDSSQTAVLTGQLSPTCTMRHVLAQIRDTDGIKHGVLRILGKEVRGSIGFFEGHSITGAHVTSSREYGLPALTVLLGASKGMFAYRAVEEPFIELKQSLALSIDELLNWREKDSQEIPPLQKSVEIAKTRSGKFPAVNVPEDDEQETDYEEDEASFESFMSWGGEAPALKLNLASLAPKLNTAAAPVSVERIAMPDDIEDLQRKMQGALGLPEETSCTSAAETEAAPEPMLPPPPSVVHEEFSPAASSAFSPASAVESLPAIAAVAEDAESFGSLEEALAIDPPLELPSAGSSPSVPVERVPALDVSSLAPPLPKPVVGGSAFLPPSPGVAHIAGGNSAFAPSSGAASAFGSPSVSSEVNASVPAEKGWSLAELDAIGTSGGASTFAAESVPPASSDVHAVDAAPGGGSAFGSPSAAADAAPAMRAPSPSIEPAQPLVKSWSLADLEAIGTTTASGGSAFAAPTSSPASSAPASAEPRVEPAVSKTWSLSDLDKIATPQKSTAAPGDVGEPPAPPVVPPIKPAASAGLEVSQRIRKLREESTTDTEKMAISQRIRSADLEAFSGERPVDHEARKQSIHKWIMVAGGVTVVVAAVLAFQIANIHMATEHFRAGINAMEVGNNHAAELELSAAIQTDPGRVQAHLYRGICYARQQEFDKALADYNAVIAASSKDVQALIGRAGIAVKMHQYQQAVQDCNTVLAMQPANLDAIRIRATGLVNTGKYGQAITDCDIFLAQTRDKADKADNTAKADVLGSKAFAELKTNKYQDAIEHYSDAIKLDPDNGSLWASRAFAYKEKKDWKNALSDSNKAIEMIQASGSLYELRAMCYKALGDSSKVLADLDKAIKRDQFNLELYRMRAAEYCDRKNWNGALADYESILQQNPKDAQAEEKSNQMRAKLGKSAPLKLASSEDNKSESGQTVSLNGSETELVRKGYQLMQSGNTAGAIPMFSAAVKKNPNDKQGRRYLAHALYLSHEFQSAAQQFASLAAIAPLDEFDATCQARALSQSGNIDGAIVAFGNILANKPDNMDIRCELANLYLQQGKNDRVQTLVQDGIRMAKTPQDKARLTEIQTKMTNQVMNAIKARPADGAAQHQM